MQGATVRPDPHEIKANFAGSEAIAKGDLIYQDNSGNAHTATTFTGLGSAAADQQAFAAVFLGIALESKQVTDTSVGTLRVGLECLADYAAATGLSGIVNGTMLTISENAGVTGLLNQLTTTTDPAKCIAMAVVELNSNPSPLVPSPNIRCIFKSNVMGQPNPNVISEEFGPVVTVIAAGNNAANAGVLPSGGTVRVTGADGTKGVILPATIEARGLAIQNAANNVLPVYPPQNGTDINNAAANTAISVSNNSNALVLPTGTLHLASIPKF